MKRTLMLAAIAAVSFGIAVADIVSTTSPALADRPGTRPTYRPSPGGTTRPGTGTGTRPTSPPTSPTSTSAVIKGASPETRVYVYKQPNSGSETVGYAFDGDPVRVYDTATGGGWYYVEFTETGARGWVQSGSLSFSSSNRG